jgi:hypothetical protein
MYNQEDVERDVFDWCWLTTKPYRRTAKARRTYEDFARMTAAGPLAQNIDSLPGLREIREARQAREVVALTS